MSKVERRGFLEFRRSFATPNLTTNGPQPKRMDLKCWWPSEEGIKARSDGFSPPGRCGIKRNFAQHQAGKRKDALVQNVHRRSLATERRSAFWRNELEPCQVASKIMAVAMRE